MRPQAWKELTRKRVPGPGQVPASAVGKSLPSHGPCCPWAILGRGLCERRGALAGPARMGRGLVSDSAHSTPTGSSQSRRVPPAWGGLGRSLCAGPDGFPRKLPGSPSEGKEKAWSPRLCRPPRAWPEPGREDTRGPPAGPSHFSALSLSQLVTSKTR